MKLGPCPLDSRSNAEQPATTPVLPGGTAERSDRALFGAAMTALGEGRMPDAALLLRETIRARPTAVHYRAAFAEILLALGNIAAAARSARLAAVLDPASPYARFTVASAALAGRQRRTALIDLLRALRLDPDFSLAHLELGRLLEAENRPIPASFHYREAVRTDPAQVEPYLRLAALQRRAGLLHEAWQNYVEALNRRPEDGATWGDLAETLSAMGERDDALSCFAEALRLAPEDTSARNNQALLLLQTGQLDRSRRGFAVALALNPAYTPVLLNGALVEAAEAEAGRALALLRRAVRLVPGRALSWNSLGQAWRQAGDTGRAAEMWKIAVALDPSCVEALGNLASDCSQREAFAEAETLMGRAMRTAGADPLLYAVLSQIFLDQMRLEDAERACRKALALSPSHADALCNLGLSLDRMNREEGLAWFTRAVVVSPGHALSQFNRGLALLRAGALAEGWQGYGHRFAAGRASPLRRFAVPEWDGSSLADRRLFIWREQGVGDEFLFASCYPDVIKKAAGTIIECDRRLVSLFQRSFPKAIVRPERPVSVPPRFELVDCDAHIPAGSLPRILRQTLPDFPPKRSSWLYPNPDKVEEWREWLEGYGPGLRVGIAWRSRLMLSERRPAYLALDRWAPVFQVPGTLFFNLQYDDCDDEIEEAEDRFHRRIHRWPWLDLRDDFEGTAALIANLDLVIAPANSVAELAGALGVPVWRFSYRDWTHLGTDVRPWYPSMRVFQPFGGQGIEGALGRIGAELPRAAALAKSGDAPRARKGRR